MLYTLTIILISIISVFLVIVILLQSGQGQGLSGGIGGGMMGGGGNMMGARRTADFLSKATSILATFFLTLCLLANFFIDKEQVGQSTIQQRGVVPAQTDDFGAPAETDPILPGQSQQSDQPQQPEQDESMPDPQSQE